MLSSRELAQVLGFTPATIRKWANAGVLQGQKYGNDWRFYQGVIGEMGRKKAYPAPQGLLRRRKSRFWYINFKGRIESTGTEDINLAQAILAERKREYHLGLVGRSRAHLNGPVTSVIDERPVSPPIPFSNLLTRYLTEVSPTKSRQGASDKTNSGMLLVFFGQIPVNKITVQLVYQYQDWRRSFWSIRKRRPVSGATINREVALLKHALHKAVRWGYLDRSPIPEGEVEGLGERKRERYITDEEFSCLYNAIPERRQFLLALYYTAQRSGNILNLRWRQIDLEVRTISFEKVEHNKRIPEIAYINDPLLAILKDLWEERKKKAMISPWVFPGRYGKPLTSIKTAWNTACRKAGVEDARIHDIRHKAITDMSRAGVPLAKIKRAVGHSQVQTTDGYTHLQVEDVKEAFEALK